jgi:predicted RNase H-like HicB family nuclease
MMLKTKAPLCSWFSGLMKLTIKLERETDGRWIADIPELGVLLYGKTKQQAIQAAESAALEIVADRLPFRARIS